MSKVYVYKIDWKNMKRLIVIRIERLIVIGMNTLPAGCAHGEGGCTVHSIHIIKRSEL